MNKPAIPTYSLFAFLLLFTVSCGFNLTGTDEEPDLKETLEPVEEVSIIDGGENVSITVNKKGPAYYSINFNDIKPNQVIENSTKVGWCIDWQKPINSNNNTYKGIKLYTTYKVEKWKSVNYLLNIEENLKSNNPDITWREIQLAIWSLRANPEFDLNKVAIEDLPGDMLTDGQPNFSYDIVNDILNSVEAGYKDFDFTAGTKFAVIVETPVDVQTLITVVE